MDLRRVLLSGVFNFSLAVLAGLFGVSQTFGDVAGFDPLSRRFWRGMLAAGSPLLDLILAHQMISAIAGLVVLVVVGLATGMVRTLMREYRFRLDHSGKGLRRRRGLLTLTDVTLPIRRIQAAIIGTGPCARRSAGASSSCKAWPGTRPPRATTSSPHSPTMPRSQRSSARSVGAQFRRAFDWGRVSVAYVWSFAAAMLLLVVPASVQLGFFRCSARPPSRRSRVLIALRWLAWRRTRYALDSDRLLVRRGWWRRRRSSCR